MKKIILTVLSATMLSVASFAQTALPTSWSFTTTTLPASWTGSAVFATSSGYYSGSGNTAPAAKFANTGDYIQIYFADAPGALTYYLAGNSFSGGTFSVLESTDGTTWSTLQDHTAPPAATYTQFTNTPNSNSRYIKFLYTAKVTGNIGLDDVVLAAGAAGAQQEISVKQGATSIVSGSDFIIGNSASTVFTVENLGTTNALTISGNSVTGTNMADFSVTGMPASVNGSSSATFTLNFNPTGADGTRTATLSISNDDANENPYVINLIGVKGSYGTEPTNQPTAFTSSNIKAYTFDVAYTAAASSPEGYIVLRKKGSAVTETPVDGTTYTRGDYVGAAQVAYIGSGVSFTPNWIVANSDYHFAIFSYNGPLGYENYLQANPLTGMVTSGGAQIGSYYSGVLPANPTLLTDLQNKIKSGTQQIYYSNYASTVVDNFASRDTTDGQKVLTCVYSGYNYVYDQPLSWGYMSREHTYCHSWMADQSSAADFYSDLYNLFPVDQDNANAVRSNTPLGEVVTIANQYLGAKYGQDANGKTVYEPRDEHKGDAARAMFYMCTRYNGLNSLTWVLPPNAQYPNVTQDQNVLKKWHYQDLPDAWEIARNEYVFSVQKNRNPFVDSVDYVCNIDFSNMTYITNPPALCYDTTSVPSSVKAASAHDLGVAVYPNPNNGTYTVNVNVSKSQMVVVSITDMLGKVIYHEHRNLAQGSQTIKFDENKLAKGIYTLSVKGENQVATKRIIVQ